MKTVKLLEEEHFPDPRLVHDLLNRIQKCTKNKKLINSTILRIFFQSNVSKRHLKKGNRFEQTFQKRGYLMTNNSRKFSTSLIIRK